MAPRKSPAASPKKATSPKKTLSKRTPPEKIDTKEPNSPRKLRSGVKLGAARATPPDSSTFKLARNSKPTNTSHRSHRSASSATSMKAHTGHSTYTSTSSGTSMIVNPSGHSNHSSAAYERIGILCDGWQLPATVSDTAKHLYKDSEASPIFKSENQDALIAGCILLACRRNNVPRAFGEVMNLTKATKKEVTKTYKMLEDFIRQTNEQQQTTSKAQTVSPMTSGSPDNVDASPQRPSEVAANNHILDYYLILSSLLNIMMRDRASEITLYGTESDGQKHTLINLVKAAVKVVEDA